MQKSWFDKGLLLHKEPLCQEQVCDSTHNPSNVTNHAQKPPEHGRTPPNIKHFIKINNLNEAHCPS